MKEEANGITLLALVVTIIVLLILAGVSLSLILGENGIIDKSKSAKNNYEEGSIKEQEQINGLTKEMEKTLHVHTEDCYAIKCIGEFKLISSEDEIFDTCVHQHTAVGTLQSGGALSDTAYYLSSGGCYTGRATFSCPGQMRVTGPISTHTASFYSSCHGTRGIGAYNFNTRCDQCGRTSTWNEPRTLCWCPTCNLYVSRVEGNTGIASNITLFMISGGTCSTARYRYGRTCGKTSGSTQYKRKVETYQCEDCGKTIIYKKEANYSSCIRCGGNHSTGEAGEKPGEHNGSEKYLICEFK